LCHLARLSLSRLVGLVARALATLLLLLLFSVAHASLVALVARAASSLAFATSLMVTPARAAPSAEAGAQ
jgi:hypothetical protein